MHNAYGMNHHTRYLDSVENSYSLVRCTEHLICIENCSELAHQRRTLRARASLAEFFLRDSLSKVVEDLDPNLRLL